MFLEGGFAQSQTQNPLLRLHVEFHQRSPSVTRNQGTQPLEIEAMHQTRGGVAIEVALCSSGLEQTPTQGNLEQDSGTP